MGLSIVKPQCHLGGEAGVGTLVEGKNSDKPEDDIPGETEEGVHCFTIREGAEKAGGQVGYLIQRTRNASPYLDGH